MSAEQISPPCWRAPPSQFIKSEKCAIRSAEGFAIGDIVVFANMETSKHYELFWAEFGVLQSKIGEIVYICDGNLFTVTFEKATFITVEARKLRKATPAQIATDWKYREKERLQIEKEIREEDEVERESDFDDDVDY
jgi:hypothetical protein